MGFTKFSLFRLGSPAPLSVIKTIITQNYYSDNYIIKKRYLNYSKFQSINIFQFIYNVDFS
jgi:hypothetical protein